MFRFSNGPDGLSLNIETRVGREILSCKIFHTFNITHYAIDIDEKTENSCRIEMCCFRNQIPYLKIIYPTFRITRDCENVNWEVVTLRDKLRRLTDKKDGAIFSKQEILNYVVVDEHRDRWSAIVSTGRVVSRMFRLSRNSDSFIIDIRVGWDIISFRVLHTINITNSLIHIDEKTENSIRIEFHNFRHGTGYIDIIYPMYKQSINCFQECEYADEEILALRDKLRRLTDKKDDSTFSKQEILARLVGYKEGFVCSENASFP